MLERKRIAPGLGGLALLIATCAAHAGQTPGMPSTWNGPWGGGYLAGGPYSPWSSPYVAAGYPIASPYGYGAAPPTQAPAQPLALPGGGYVLPPGPGGGMLPGAYGR